MNVAGHGSVDVDVVVPTVGRPSLARLLQALAEGTGPRPRRVLLVDDRRDPDRPLVDVPPGLRAAVEVLRGRAAGPAAARNVGWRASAAEWIAFVDDDVVPGPDWLQDLADDLRAAAPEVGGVQGRLHVPLPTWRRPTDWERNVAGLAHARWATADLAYRREALERVGGFDERFPHAYREDADLGLRVTAAGYPIVSGRRRSTHPVRPAGRWVSVRLQTGNADDALMRVLHGPGWRERAGVPAGRRPRHVAVTAAALAGVVLLGLGRRRAAAVAGAAWLAGTAELAWARIAPGPRTAAEVGTMLATSAALPAAATLHWARGWVTMRSRLVAPGAPRPRPGAVLFDRDGTLVLDVPYNGDPARVIPAPGAAAALARLRAAGVPTAVVSNQSGIARGVLTAAQVHAVNRRIDDLLGPLGPWLFCPHGPDDGCACRKPAPGMVLDAAAALGVRPEQCVLVGDTGADVGAARAAGARAVLVPTTVTRREEIADAAEVAPDLGAAIDLLLGASR